MMHELDYWRGEYHLLIDLARILICDMHFSEVIQGRFFLSAADPSTLRMRTWSKDARTSEHAIDERCPLRTAK